MVSIKILQGTLKKDNSFESFVVLLSGIEESGGSSRALGGIPRADCDTEFSVCVSSLPNQTRGG